MPRTNETGHIERHETCKCKCRLDAVVCLGTKINADANVKK